MNGEQIPNKGVMKKFLSMLKKARLPYLWLVGQIVVSVVITNVGISVTEYTSEMFAGNVSFTGIILPFILYSLASLALAAVSGIVDGITTAKIDRNLRRMLWKKIVRLPYSYYQKNDPEEMISRLTSDISSVSTLIQQLLVGFFSTLYATVAVFQKIQNYDEKLMLTMVVLLPLQAAIAVLVGRLQFIFNDKLNLRRAELTQSVAERTDQTMLMKSFGTQKKEELSMGKRILAYYKAYGRNIWLSRLLSPVYTIVNVLQFVVLVMVGRGFYSSGAISLAQWVAFYAFSNQVINNLASYANYWTDIRATQGSTWRVSNIMEAPEERAEEGEPAENLSGDIVLLDVTFGYEEGNFLFRNLSLKIPQGKTTAIIGKSGSGKTTLLNLIDRLYEPESGDISIGEDVIARFSRRSYRQQITYITQETVLFAGTIRQNLVYGLTREVEDEELLEVCKRAGLLEDVLSMPLQLETQVGEDGSRLSGGQRQKLAVARVLLKPTEYFLIDEGTAAMDAGAKETVWETLLQLAQGKTTVYVAHDRQTILKAEHVILMDNGAVVAQGSLEEMLKTEPYLQSLMEGRDSEEA